MTGTCAKAINITFVNVKDCQNTKTLETLYTATINLELMYSVILIILILDVEI